ncbi:MAG: hypothetical protein WC294_02265 [Methanoregula sp.]|jgi:hypothetical protein
MKTPGPFTRCGTVCLENDTVKITYDAGGVTHSAFILEAANLSGNRDAVPVPVFARGPEGFTKTGYAYRSPSGRAFVISTTTSQGDLTCEWNALQRIIHQRSKQVPISRLNATTV